MAQSNLINKGCYISNTSKRKILSALIEDCSMTSIAGEYNVSVNTVQRVLESCSSNFYDDFDHLPKHLAFDEFKGVGKKLHFICLDGLDCDQTLENTYWVMQDFMVAIQNNDEKKAIHLLHSKQMHQTLLTFKRNYSGVLNGISSTYSNGCLEGVNRKIK